jgi:hypothetical protein
MDEIMRNKYIPIDLPLNLYNAKYIETIATEQMDKELLITATKLKIFEKINNITGCTYIYYYDDTDIIIIWSHKYTKDNSNLAKYIIINGLNILINAKRSIKISTYCGIPINLRDVHYKYDIDVSSIDTRTLYYAEKYKLFQKLNKLTGCSFININNNTVTVWSNNETNENYLLVKYIILNWMDVLTRAISEKKK